MPVIGKVNHIQGYTPFDVKTTDNNTVKNIAKTYYPVTMFFHHHEAMTRLFRNDRGMMMVGNVMESPTGVMEPSIRDIELYVPYMGDQRFPYDQSQTIMMINLMVKGSLIFNHYIKEHEFYEIMFLVRNLDDNSKSVISPDEFVTDQHNVRPISFGLRRVLDKTIINSIR